MIEPLAVGDVASGVRYADYLRAAGACRTESEFRRSPFFSRHGETLERLLQTPQLVPHASPRPAQHPPGRLRVVHWNIEKGKQLPLIVERLSADPLLCEADVYTFNEVDVGMARSGPNANVAAVLAEALECHYVYVPSYLECTKGPAEEALSPGENHHGWHGLAILSRFEIEEARVVALPSCFDYFDFFEKRFGGRQGLITLLHDGRGRRWEVATTHLEVRESPDCRARQMQVLLEALAVGGAGSPRPVPRILTGDWNTNSFRRGSLARSVREFWRIVTTPRPDLDTELRAPFQREPLFALLEDHGFEVRGLSDGEATAEQILGTAEDLELVPRPIREWLSRTFGLGTRVLRMRLDWIAAAGLTSIEAATHSAQIAGEPASDHALVHADLS